MKAIVLTPVLALAVACQPDEANPLALRSGFTINAAAVDFGTLAVGERAAVALDVANRGQVGLWIEAAIDGAPAAVFTVNHDEFFLEVGATATLDLSFAPDRPEQFSATLRLADRADPATAESVALSGGGLLPDCEDRNPCTEDLFDLGSRTCRHDPRPGACDDDRRCTADDRCVQGVCQGQPIACADTVDCTIDACDEQQGCLAIPDHSRCGASDPCTVGRCDAVTGCQVAAASDGTPCGDFSCAEMHICLRGTCRSAPTPDGMPCDDGDLCTSGDSCRAGSCQPGVGVTLGAAQPIDFLFGSALANAGVVYFPYGDPTAVLAIHVPASGGLEVIWTYTPYWQDVTVQILRTRLEASGAIVASETLFVAAQTSAAYDGDDLLTLIGGCRGCCQGDLSCPDPGTEEPWVEPCQLLLRRYPADGSAPSDVCVGHGGYGYPGVLALDVVDGTSRIALTVARTDDSTLAGANVVVQSVDRNGQPSSLETVYRWDDPISSYLPNARLLQIASTDQRPLIALTHVEELGGTGCGCSCCATCDCDADAECPYWDYGAVLLDPATGARPIGREFHLGGTARGLGLSPGLGLTGWLWRQGRLEDGIYADCSLHDELILFADRGDQGLAQRAVISEPAGSIVAVSPATFGGQPAALLQRDDGQLTFYAMQTSGSIDSIAVPAPMAIYSQMARSFAPALAYYPYHAPAAISAPIPGGLVVAALTGPYIETAPYGEPSSDAATGEGAGASEAPPPYSNYGIAFFTVGCDATIPPRQ